MHKLFTLLALSVVLSATAQNSGGPDPYGYYWRNSDHPQGPTYDWVDITGVGTQVTGLTDDNATNFITMGGMVFHYYWTDVTKIVIGSNGWLGFSPVANIAHCFPTMPTAGGQADHYLAPFMSDLLISQPGLTTPEVWWHFDQPNNRFIVSYINCPWWSPNAPGYVGNNTFQVILSGQDSSITYQYQSLTPGLFNNMANCSQDLVVGLENVTGAIGLQVYQEVLPPDNFAIKFYYPSSVTFQIQDATPQWNQNTESRGIFVQSGSTFNLQTGIRNTGNADITTQVMVSGVLEDLSLNQVHSAQASIQQGLVAGQLNTVVFPQAVSLAPGQYYFNTTTSNPQDLNAGNNSRSSEINAVDMTQGNFTLSYATQSQPDNMITWGGPGGGVGVRFTPPAYPVSLNSVLAFILDQGLGGQDFEIRVYDDDGANGMPGTLLATVPMSALNYLPNQWVAINMPTPIEITSGSFYVGWVHYANATIALGTELNGPISRQTLEFVGGDWAEYRESASTDFLINAMMTSSCGGLSVNVQNVSQVTCFGGSNGAININVNGGTPGYTIVWDHNIGSVEDPANLGAGVYVVSITDANGCSTGTNVTINQPAQITVDAQSTPEVQGSDGTITANASGGTPPFTYAWSNGGIGPELGNLTAGDYTVTVTDANGCTQTAVFTVSSEVGVGEFELANAKVYPNPSLGVLYIELPAGLEGVAVELADMIGRVVPINRTNSSNKLELNLPRTEAGVYMLTIRKNQSVLRQRVVVGGN